MAHMAARSCATKRPNAPPMALPSLPGAAAMPRSIMTSRPRTARRKRLMRPGDDGGGGGGGGPCRYP